MSTTERRYVLDTNLFIEGLRDPAAKTQLIQFHRVFAPFEYLSAIVIQELRAGTRSKDDLRRLENNVLTPFARRGRVLTPSARAWELSGDVLRQLAATDGLDLRALSKSFGNDVLLALSCRESGMVLVTSNTRDFQRINRAAAFSFVAPWPTPIG